MSEPGTFEGERKSFDDAKMNGTNLRKVAGSIPAEVDISPSPTNPLSNISHSSSFHDSTSSTTIDSSLVESSSSTAATDDGKDSSINTHSLITETSSQSIIPSSHTTYPPPHNTVKEPSVESIETSETTSNVPISNLDPSPNSNASHNPVPYSSSHINNNLNSHLNHANHDQLSNDQTPSSTESLVADHQIQLHTTTSNDEATSASTESNADEQESQSEADHASTSVQIVGSPASDSHAQSSHQSTSSGMEVDSHNQVEAEMQMEVVGSHISSELPAISASHFDNSSDTTIQIKEESSITTLEALQPELTTESSSGFAALSSPSALTTSVPSNGNPIEVKQAPLTTATGGSMVFTNIGKKIKLNVKAKPINAVETLTTTVDSALVSTSITSSFSGHVDVMSVDSMPTSMMIDPYSTHSMEGISSTSYHHTVSTIPMHAAPSSGKKRKAPPYGGYSLADSYGSLASSTDDDPTYGIPSSKRSKGASDGTPRRGAAKASGFSSYGKKSRHGSDSPYLASNSSSPSVYGGVGGSAKKSKSKTKTRPLMSSRELSGFISGLAIELVSEIMALPESWPFNQPVDPIALGIPHYRSIVKHPMDLKTLKTNIKKGHYSSLPQFEHDIKLVWNNAMLFNQAGSEIHNLALFLSNYVDPKIKKLYDSLNHGQVSPDWIPPHLLLPGEISSNSASPAPSTSRSASHRTHGSLSSSHHKHASTGSTPYKSRSSTVDTKKNQLDAKVKQTQQAIRAAESQLNTIKKSGLNKAIDSLIEQMESEAHKTPANSPFSSLASASTTTPESLSIPLPFDLKYNLYLILNSLTDPLQVKDILTILLHEKYKFSKTGSQLVERIDSIPTETLRKIEAYVREKVENASERLAAEVPASAGIEEEEEEEDEEEEWASKKGKKSSKRDDDDTSEDYEEDEDDKDDEEFEDDALMGDDDDEAFEASSSSSYARSSNSTRAHHKRHQGGSVASTANAGTDEDETVDVTSSHHISSSHHHHQASSSSKQLKSSTNINGASQKGSKGSTLSGGSSHHQPPQTQRVGLLDDSDSDESDSDSDDDHLRASAMLKRSIKMPSIIQTSSQITSEEVVISNATSWDMLDGQTINQVHSKDVLSSSSFTTSSIAGGLDTAGGQHGSIQNFPNSPNSTASSNYPGSPTTPGAPLTPGQQLEGENQIWGAFKQRTQEHKTREAEVAKLEDQRKREKEEKERLAKQEQERRRREAEEEAARLKAEEEAAQARRMAALREQREKERAELESNASGSGIDMMAQYNEMRSMEKAMSKPTSSDTMDHTTNQ